MFPYSLNLFMTSAFAFDFPKCRNILEMYWNDFEMILKYIGKKWEDYFLVFLEEFLQYQTLRSITQWCFYLALQFVEWQPVRLPDMHEYYTFQWSQLRYSNQILGTALVRTLFLILILIRRLLYSKLTWLFRSMMHTSKWHFLFPCRFLKA